MTQGFFDAALHEADEGYHQTEGHDLLWSWKFRVLKAEVHLRRGNPRQALELLAAEVEAGLATDLSVHKKIAQGEALCQLNRPQDSARVLTEAERLIPLGRRDLQGELTLTRGRCALPVNRAIAKEYFESAAKLAHGGDNFVEAIALLNSGWVLFKEQDCGKAINQLQEALALTDSPWVREKTLGNLALCHADMGDWRQSIAVGEQAKTLAEQISNTGDQEKWLMDLGRAHFVLAEFSEADKYYRQAYSIAKTRNDSDAVARCLNNLTQQAVKRHDLNAAETYWKEESALSLSAEGSAYVTFDAATITSERKEFSTAEHLFQEILNSKPPDSLRLTTEQELGKVYWQENKPVEADRAFREAIHDAETVLAHLPPQYWMSFLDEQPFYDPYMRFLVAQGRSLEALKVAERGRAQILSRALRVTPSGPSSFDVATVQAVLKKSNQIVLAYSLTNEESFLWVITPKVLKSFTLPSHKIIAGQIDVYTHEVVDHPRAIEDSPGLQELYKTLVQPAENLIPKGSRVVVITSKILSLVNFEALVVPGDHPHYWIQDVEIETASSLALLARSRPSVGKTGMGKKELLLLGAPVQAVNSLPVLKHAAEEMDRVRNHFPAGQETIISGQDAVPQAYRASKPGQYRLIHIDAHSLPSDLNPLDSYVVLSPAAGNSYKLYARDIEDTPLQADLVTISACYSAGNRWYQGEGIVGLGWAFLRAGAHQVVASLWAVDEASTPQLMDDFYGELSHGRSAAEALRDAKLNMLNSGGQRSKPYYWASLQLYTGS